MGEDSLLIERISQLAILITLLCMLTEFSREIYSYNREQYNLKNIVSTCCKSANRLFYSPLFFFLFFKLDPAVLFAQSNTFYSIASEYTHFTVFADLLHSFCSVATNWLLKKKKKKNSPFSDTIMVIC